MKNKIAYALRIFSIQHSTTQIHMVKLLGFLYICCLMCTQIHTQQTPSSAVYTNEQNKWLKFGLLFFRPVYLLRNKNHYLWCFYVRPPYNSSRLAQHELEDLYIFISFRYQPCKMEWYLAVFCRRRANCYCCIWKRQREQKKKWWRCENLCRSNDNESYNNNERELSRIFE